MLFSNGSINSHFTVFSRPVSPGTIVLGTQNDKSTGNPYDRNMYGVAVVACRKAMDPLPTDRGTGGGGTLLQWTPGFGAVLHNVYIGRSPRFSQMAAVGYYLETPRCQLVDDLVPGATYFWRVDEVQADLLTVVKGDRWEWHCRGQAFQ